MSLLLFVVLEIKLNYFVFKFNVLDTQIILFLEQSRKNNDFNSKRHQSLFFFHRGEHTIYQST